jgi:competence protein ComFB
MKLEEIYSFEELTNEAERFVIEELGRQLEIAGETACRSPECVLDMAAYALNHVKPMYRVNLLGRLYVESLHEEHKEEIRRAVQQAILKVSRDR